MRELRFVAVSEDGRGLVLSDADGDYVLAIDDAVRAAVRQDRSRLGHLQVEAEAIRPRDIQARIRAGETAEDVAVAAGIPLEKVRRYEGPVLAEREHVAAQAQSATVRDTDSAEGPAPRLGELIQSRFEPLGIDLAVLGWDAWRREDGRWVVRLVYPHHGRVRGALWLYDPERRVVFPQDAQARALVDGAEPAAADPTPAPVRRLASVPREQDQAGAQEHRGAGATDGFVLAPTPQDVQLPLEAEAGTDVPSQANGAQLGAPQPTATDVGENGADAGTEGVTSTQGVTSTHRAATGTDGADAAVAGRQSPRHAADPTGKPGRAPRRAAVPSWDDIVFGTRKKD